MAKKSDWVPASKAGRAAYCPHSLELDRAGAKVSAVAQKARIRGDAEHDTLNRIAAAQDKRCFVACHLYGVDDHRTQLLREYRDEVLVQNNLGRFAVSVYYRLSPFAVVAAKVFPFVNRALLFLVDSIVNLLSTADPDKKEQQ